MGAVTAADPFHEGAYRTLMTALAASGRRYDALAAFDRLREVLTEEYAADPEPATRRLYRDLLTARRRRRGRKRRLSRGVSAPTGPGRGPAARRG